MSTSQPGLAPLGLRAVKLPGGEATYHGRGSHGIGRLFPFGPWDIGFLLVTIIALSQSPESCPAVL